MSSTQEEVVDAQIVPEGEEATPAVARPVSMELAPRQRRSEVIRPLNADALAESFQEYQDLLPRLLKASDWQDAGRGERFVKKSGWRKIATAFDLDVQIVRSEVERSDDGQPLRAEVWARAIAPSGRSMDGDGYCSVDESRFARESGRGKLENDLRATATTRAMNRAISGLVGMGAVSAEEVDSGGGQGGGFVEASQELQETTRLVLAYLFDGDEYTAGVTWGSITERYEGRLTRDAGQAICLVGSAVKASRMQASAPTAGPPPDHFDPEGPGGQLDMAEAQADAAGGGHYDG